MKSILLALTVLVSSISASAIVDMRSAFLTATLSGYQYGAPGTKLKSRVTVRQDGVVTKTNSKGVTKEVGVLDDDTMGSLYSLMSEAQDGELVSEHGIVCLAIPDTHFTVVGHQIQPNDAIVTMTYLSALSPCGHDSKHSTEAGRKIAKFAQQLFDKYN